MEYFVYMIGIYNLQECLKKINNIFVKDVEENEKRILNFSKFKYKSWNYLKIILRKNIIICVNINFVSLYCISNNTYKFIKKKIIIK